MWCGLFCLSMSLKRGSFKISEESKSCERYDVEVPEVLRELVVVKPDEDAEADASEDVEVEFHGTGETKLGCDPVCRFICISLYSLSGGFGKMISVL